MKGKLSILLVVMTVAGLLMVQPAMTKEFIVGGNSLRLLGYVTQGVQYSLVGDNYDVENHFNQALMNIFMEGSYLMPNNLSFYASGLLTVDWMYDLKHDEREWTSKLFNESRDRMYIDDEYWQLLKEVHLTWDPGPFIFRVGKQIVAWGETDGFRLMDQINPIDQRRGFSDVEFETSVIPIWLVRGDYYATVGYSWLSELGLQFVFNPNVTFIPDQGPALGNDVGGIWAPKALIRDPSFPFGVARLGSAHNNIDQPSSFDSKGFEYAFKLTMTMYDTLVTFNGFYGRENAPVTLVSGAPDVTVAYDGRLLLHLPFTGEFPLQRFAGITLNRTLPALQTGWMTTPVLRAESFYAYHTTFATNLNTFDQFNEVRWAVAFETKMRINFINSKGMIGITPQFYQRHIVEYPNEGINGVDRNTYYTTVYVSTNYYNARIQPMAFWLHDIEGRADFLKLQCKYVWTDKWNFTLGAFFFTGGVEGKSFQVFESKDSAYFKVTYQWG